MEIPEENGDQRGPRNKRLLVLVGIAVLVLVAAVVSLVVAVVYSVPQSPEVGALAPDFEVPTLNNETVKLSAFRGQPVLLNIWANWCGGCKEEMPHLQAVFEERAGDGLVVLAVHVRQGQSDAQSFVQQYGYTFPVGLDVDGSVEGKYQVEVIPMTFFIDREGIIRFIKVGVASKAELDSALESIL
jgi:peroxiredoxin